MENETQEEVVTQVEQKSSLHQITPLSKYLALALFVILPFLGGYVGYTFAPEKVVEVVKEVEITSNPETIKPVGTPFAKADKKFYTNDFFWDVDVVLEGEKLFWKHDYKDEWNSIIVKNTETIEYIGHGVFSDGIEIYSLGYLQGTEVLDPTKKLTTISEKGQDLMQNGEKLFALVSEMSLPVLSEVENIDVENFEIIGGGYLKDVNSVFFMGANTWMLQSANPVAFTIYQPDVNNEKFILGVSGVNVYYKYKLLEGIDFNEMRVEKFNSIIRDTDTVWYSSGNCHFGDFTKGELDKIETYQPPC
jgi:hypothetical protein